MSSDFQANNHFEKFRPRSTKFLDVKLTYLGSLNNSKLIKQSILSRKPIIDNNNTKETECFERFVKTCKNLNLIKIIVLNF